MRAFLCTAPSANNTAIPDSRVWINNLSRGLSSLGIDVLTPSFEVRRHTEACKGNVPGVDPGTARMQYSELLLRDVEKALQERGVDLFLAYVWSIHLLPKTLLQIRAWGVPTVLFYCNAVHQFHLVEELAPYFDFCMVPECEALAKYHAVGANPLRIQMAADPDMYRPQQSASTYDVTFVGQKYLNRPDYVGYLVWHGIDVQVWGPGWLESFEWLERMPLRRKVRRTLGSLWRAGQHAMRVEPSWYPVPRDRCGGILTDEEMVQVFSQSQISLNFSEVEDQITGERKRHIRLRDFEIPMSGGLLVTGHQEELAEYYEIGREIICYHAKEDLLDKCRYYLRHPRQAEAIRQAGYRRARAEHTWARRFEQLLAHMGLSAPRVATAEDPVASLM